MRWLSAIILSLLVHILIIFAYSFFSYDSPNVEDRTITGIKFLEPEIKEETPKRESKQIKQTTKPTQVKQTTKTDPVKKIENFDSYIAQEVDQKKIAQNADIAEEISQKIINDLEQIWIKPNNTRKGMYAEFNLQVDRLGNIKNFKLIRSSGSPAFDRAATSAINKYKKIAYLKEIDDDTYKRYFSNFNLRFKPK